MLPKKIHDPEGFMGTFHYYTFRMQAVRRKKTTPVVEAINTSRVFYGTSKT